VNNWKQYKRKGLSEMRPYVPGEDMVGVSVSAPDVANGSPKPGDMIARNPKNHDDQQSRLARYHYKTHLLSKPEATRLIIRLKNNNWKPLAYSDPDHPKNWKPHDSGT